MHQIQDATYAARRTQGYGSKQDTKVKPFVGGDPGTPDLAYKAGRRVELAELKPADFGALYEGEVQVQNYVAHGNSEENRIWRRGLGLAASDAFSLMTPNRYTPPGQVSVGQQKVEVSWCLPGVLGYRALTREEAETILCTVSDKGAIDKFLNVALDGAEATVDRFIDSLDRLLTQRIQALGIRKGLMMLAQSGRSALRAFLESQLSEGAGALVDVLPDDELIDVAARWVEEEVGAQAEATLRSIVLQAKTKLFAEVRMRIKDQLRTYLQETFAAVCAAAAVGVTVSVAQLLKRFSQDLGKRFADTVVAVVKEWADAVVKELVKALVIALLVAVAIVAVIVFLPEIVAALAAVAEFAVAAGAAAAALGPRLAPMLNDLVRLALPAVPAFQGAP